MLSKHLTSLKIHWIEFQLPHAYFQSFRNDNARIIDFRSTTLLLNAPKIAISRKNKIEKAVVVMMCTLDARSRVERRSERRSKHMSGCSGLCEPECTTDSSCATNTPSSDNPFDSAISSNTKFNQLISKATSNHIISCTLHFQHHKLLLQSIESMQCLDRSPLTKHSLDARGTEMIIKTLR